MTTSELVHAHRELIRTGDATAASLLLDRHRDNELFVSLVELRATLIPALVDHFSRLDSYGLDRTWPGQ